MAEVGMKTLPACVTFSRNPGITRAAEFVWRHFERHRLVW
jgi:hypothetical protein